MTPHFITCHKAEVLQVLPWYSLVRLSAHGFPLNIVFCSNVLKNPLCNSL